MISFDEALNAYARHLEPLDSESVATTDALGRVLAADANAQSDLPRFDQSALDGYAFRGADTERATTLESVDLPVALILPAGGVDDRAVLPKGAAARIFTGAMLPLGADTMIAQERADRIGDSLRFVRPFAARQNIRWRGEELANGERIAEHGQRIGPGLLASLVNAEVAEVLVHRRPRLRIFVTGDEIRPPGTVLRPGEIHDSNGPLVTSMLRSWGFDVDPAVHLRDDEDEVRAALADAFGECDLVISTGGASVGDKDYLPAVSESLGARRVFWKVAQKPAKPIFFGLLEHVGHRRCAMIALPGNPGAVLIGLLLHVRAAIDVLEGQREPGARWQRGLLAEPVARDPERTRLVRMRFAIDDSGVVRLLPLPLQDSHMLSNLSRAEVLVRIEPGENQVDRGAPLDWTAMPG